MNKMIKKNENETLLNIILIIPEHEPVFAWSFVYKFM